jgi:periplasmic divalent cation tolerance protein
VASSAPAMVVLCTAPSEEDAARLARELVEARVCACVNLVSPVRSIYRWEGEVHDEAEHLLVIKTSSDRFEPLRDLILAKHPYEAPEVIALPIVAGSEAYLSFIVDETRPAPAGPK